MKSKDLPDLVAEAGLVGAGGAGFPTAIKLKAKADTVIANGAECEPLLYSDYHCMKQQMNDVVAGLRQVMECVGASRGIIAIKEKRGDLLDEARRAAAGSTGVEVAALEDYYPAGDEHVLVHELLGRVVPHGGIPPDVRTVVQNVGTLAQVARAAGGEPVTWRYVTVAGAVREPVTFRAPIGTPIGSLVAACGGATVEDPVLLHGGAMMGERCEPGRPVAKNTTGVVVLPAESLAVREPEDTLAHTTRIAASVCDQCYACTELCPRQHLGHAIEPHRIMRAVSYGFGTIEPGMSNPAYCCECGICSLYACPMGIFPRRIIQLKKPGSPRPAAGAIEVKPVNPHIRDKRLPLKRLMERLQLAEYDRKTELREAPPAASVRIPLRQGAGAASVPVVREGQFVRKGQKVADAGVPVGAAHHASIDGKVGSIGDSIEIVTGRG